MAEYFFANGGLGKGPLGEAIVHNGMARALDLLVHSQERDGPEAPIAPELFESVIKDNADRQRLMELGIGILDADAIVRERNGDIVLNSGFYTGRNRLKRLGGTACAGIITGSLIGIATRAKHRMK